jgi:hypothetical protein
LVEAVQILGPHFDGNIYRIADHVRRIIELGVPPVPLFNGGHRVHRNCISLGMIGVVGRYDPHDGKAYLEIRPRQSLDRWFWDVACTLGRAAFEANLPKADKPRSAPSKPLPLPKAVAKRLKHGPQIDRVYLPLRIDFPPYGMTPRSLSAERCKDRLSNAGHWKAENEEFGLTDPSPDVVGIAMNLLGRTTD